MALARHSESFENYKKSFLESPYVKADTMMQIRDISQAENQYLYPYFLRFKDQMGAYTSGIFILDARGIYTPIESGYFGVVHVERLPMARPPIYAITDLTDCAIMDFNERTLIFQGVILTPYGYRFIDDNFHIKPITGLSFSAPRLMVGIDETAAREEAGQRDDEEDFVS